MPEDKDDKVGSNRKPVSQKFSPRKVLDLPHKVIRLIKTLWDVEWGERDKHSPVLGTFCAGIGAALGIIVALFVLVMLTGTASSFKEWLATSGFGLPYVATVVTIIVVVCLILPGVIGFLVDGASPNDLDLISLAWRGALTPALFLSAGLIMVLVVVILLRLIKLLL